MRAEILGVLLLVLTLSAQEPPATNVRVPDASTALGIAEPALTKVCRKRKIEYEKPLRAIPGMRVHDAPPVLLK
jgi:hypothetical protein